MIIVGAKTIFSWNAWVKCFLGHLLHWPTLGLVESLMSIDCIIIICCPTPKVALLNHSNIKEPLKSLLDFFSISPDSNCCIFNSYYISKGISEKNVSYIWWSEESSLIWWSIKKKNGLLVIGNIAPYFWWSVGRMFLNFWWLLERTLLKLRIG